MEGASKKSSTEDYIRGCKSIWIRGAMVARLTPDQKVACSIHVGFIF
jgi:hypothetical protein